MTNTTVYGVDLAKNVIHVCSVANQQVLSNIEMTPHKVVPS